MGAGLYGLRTRRVRECKDTKDNSGQECGCAGMQQRGRARLHGVQSCRKTFMLGRSGGLVLRSRVQVCWGAKAQGCRDTWVQVDAGIQGRGAGSQGFGV